MDELSLYFNPRCSKCRTARGLLAERGIDAHIVEYLKAAPTVPELRALAREDGALRWELEAHDSGTRLTLWANIVKAWISAGAAGWHISFDVLERQLAGEPIGRMVGPDVMKFSGWQRLNSEYAKQFETEAPNWPPKAAQKS